MDILDGFFGYLRQPAYQRSPAAVNQTHLQTVQQAATPSPGMALSTQDQAQRMVTQRANQTIAPAASQKPEGLIGSTVNWFNSANAQASSFIKQRLPPQLKPGNPIYEAAAPTALTLATAITRGPTFLATPPAVRDFQVGMIKGGYDEFVEQPVTAGASYVAGAAIGGGLGLAAKGGARLAGSAAVKTLPKVDAFVSSVSKCDILGKGTKAMGAIYALDVGARVVGPDQTPRGMGGRAGGILATEAIPMYYGGRSAMAAIGASGDAFFKLDSRLTERSVLSRLPDTDVKAAKATFAISRNIKNVYSRLQNEPDLAAITNVGQDFAAPMKAYVSKQTHAVIGAGTRTGQIPKDMWARTTKDLDILVEEPMAFSRGALKEVFDANYALEVVPPGAKPVAAIRTGRGRGSTAVDPHSFPEGYPIGKKAPSVDDYTEPYTIKFMPKELLRGPDLTQEYLYTQVMRKANAVIGAPKGADWSFGPRPHRLKDSLDLVTDTKFLAGELRAQTSISQPVTSARNLAKAARLEKNADAIVNYYADPVNVKEYKDADVYLGAFQKLQRGDPLSAIDVPDVPTGTNVVSIPKGSPYPFASDISPAPRGATLAPFRSGTPPAASVSAKGRSPSVSDDISSLLDIPSSVVGGKSPSTKARSSSSGSPATHVPTKGSSLGGRGSLPVRGILPASTGAAIVEIPARYAVVGRFDGGSPVSPPVPPDRSPEITPEDPKIPELSAYGPPSPSTKSKPFLSISSESKKQKKKHAKKRDPYDWFVQNPVPDIPFFFGTGAKSPAGKKAKAPRATMEIPDAFFSGPGAKRQAKNKKPGRRGGVLAGPGKEFFEVRF